MIRPRTCRSVPCQACTARRASPATVTGQPPAAAVSQRAGPAGRGAGRADQRPEFHHGGGEPGGSRRFGRQQGRHLGAGRLSVAGSRGSSTPADHPGQHPADVGVDDRRAGAERERGDRAGRVLADTRQSQQPSTVVGHHDRRRSTIAVARRAAAAPGAGSPAVPRPGSPQPGSRRPGRRASASAASTRRIDRQHPDHRRLLQHHLADQHRPGRRRGRRATADHGRGCRRRRAVAGIECAGPAGFADSASESARPSTMAGAYGVRNRLGMPAWWSRSTSSTKTSSSRPVSRRR